MTIRKLIQFLFVLLLMTGLSATEAFGQAQRVKPRKKPPTTTTTTTPTKPTKPRKENNSKKKREAEEQRQREEEARKKHEAEEAVRRQREEEEFERMRPFKELEANMVRVEGGTFTMGATSEQGSDADNDEKPTHQVTLSSFSICKYEVTQELWETVMGSNPSYNKGAKHPVEQVSWEDCQTFISKLNQLTGKKVPSAYRGRVGVCCPRRQSQQWL